MASIEPASSDCIGIDRDIPITAATRQATPFRLALSPLRALAVRVPDQSSTLVKVLVRAACRFTKVSPPPPVDKYLIPVDCFQSSRKPRYICLLLDWCR